MAIRQSVFSPRTVTVAEMEASGDSGVVCLAASRRRAAVLGRDGVEAKQRIRRERPVFADGVGGIIADGGLVLPDIVIELEAARKRGEERPFFALVGEAVLQVVFKGQIVFAHHVIGDALGGEAEIARLRRRADFALELILNVEQALDQQRVEHAAFAVLNHPNGGFVRIGLFDSSVRR